MNPKDIIICNYPCELTVGDVRKLLVQKDEIARKLLAGLILHRLRNRYATPLEYIPRDFKSGFLIMAAACLMIEAFQSFKDGKKSTRNESQAAFKRFFQCYSDEFCGLDGKVFYEKIRCGILHQAQTEGCYRILRKGSIFDHAEKTINATEFLRTLKGIVEKYVDDLRAQDMDSDSWRNPLLKIKYICDAIENDEPAQRRRTRRSAPRHH